MISPRTFSFWQVRSSEISYNISLAFHHLWVIEFGSIISLSLHKSWLLLELSYTLPCPESFGLSNVRKRCHRRGPSIIAFPVPSQSNRSLLAIPRCCIFLEIARKLSIYVLSSRSTQTISKPNSQSRSTWSNFPQ
ncbi:hypothetical protein SLE2022_265860 [Rubroshorea leprosula]